MSARRLASSCLLASALALTASGAWGQTLFEDVDGAFGPQGCQDGDPEDVGCWTNYLRLSDIDGDGDLDAIFPNSSGFFAQPGAQPLEIFLNDGEGTFEPGTAELLGADVEGAHRVVAIGDVDGNGRRDLFIPSASGGADRLFLQDDEGAFVDEAAERIGSRSRSAAARFGDVDGDGDLDLAVGVGYASSDSPPARLYFNDGAGNFVELEGALPFDVEGQDVDDLDFFDADGDSNLDLFVNTHSGKCGLWLNDGTGLFQDASSRIPDPEDGSAYHYGPAACDIDGDGDRDLLIDNIGPDYGEQVLVNDGTGHFTAESDRLAGNDDGDDDNGIVCLDFDDDGDLDVVVMSLSSNGERLFENDGTGHFTRVDDAFTPLVDPTLWMEAGDVDGDGRLDVVTSQGEGDPQLERLYLGTDAVAVDASPPRVFAVDSTSFFPEIRFAVQDNATSDEGPRIRSADARVPDAESPIPAMFMGGDLFRVLVPEDATELSLCATDLRDNVGCVDVVLGEGGGGGQGGEGGSLGDGGYQPSVTAAVGNGGATTDAGSTSTTTASTAVGSGGGDVAILGDDGGCGCVTAGAEAAPRGLLAGLAFACAATLRRGDRRRRHAARGGRS